MRVLVTWGSKRGGTAGIGEIIADALAANGVEVVATPVERVGPLDGFGAVIIGGASSPSRVTRATLWLVGGACQ